jgi:hypothetical protein
MADEREVELVLGSRTQSPEVIKQVMEAAGYDVADIAVQSDAPPTPPPAEPAAVEETTSSAPPPDAGPAAGAEGDGGIPAEGAGSEAGAPGGDGPEPPPATEQPKAKKPGSARLKEEVARLRAELEQLKAEKPAAAGEPPARDAAPPVKEGEPAPPSPPAEQPEPTLRQYTQPGGTSYVEGEDYDDAAQRWIRDHRKWERTEEARLAAEETAAKQRAEAENATKAAQQAEEDAWKAQSQQVADEHPDFAEVIAQPLFTPAMQYALKLEEDGARLAYWLGKHPEEANRIAHLHLSEDGRTLKAGVTPARAVAICTREFAKIDPSAGIAPTSGSREAPAGKSTPPAPPPTAPPPPKAAAAAPVAAPPRPKAEPPEPVKGRGGAATKRYPQDYTKEELKALTTDEVRELRNMKYA